VIRKLSLSNFDSILRVINDAAQAYKGVIPDDLWKEPYMSSEELRHEIDSGVEFYGWFENDALLGIMGIQFVGDVTLIRHAYVLPEHQRRGIGSEILVGTWAGATWAIRFYEKHGFKLVSPEEKDKLLRTYWNIPEKQIEASVVLRLRK
jgi:GNAT superfamily N-acetyltransferase